MNRLYSDNFNIEMDKEKIFSLSSILPTKKNHSMSPRYSYTRYSDIKSKQKSLETKANRTDRLCLQISQQVLDQYTKDIIQQK